MSKTGGNDMKEFMDKDFMLQNDTAKKLYHDYAAEMPIFDYHCHLVPQMMYEDKPFDNITQIFLKRYSRGLYDG